jgi:hypothetical protein
MPEIEFILLLCVLRLILLPFAFTVIGLYVFDNDFFLVLFSTLFNFVILYALSFLLLCTAVSIFLIYVIAELYSSAPSFLDFSTMAVAL